MARKHRPLLAAAVALFAALVGTPRALACGSNGYSYAGLGAPEPALGISATLTSVADFDVTNGHVAAYIDVGGPGQGPRGTNEWLQAGLSRFPSVTGSDVYYEVALPGRFPVYHQLAAGVAAGTAVNVALREIYRRPNWWRVWLNGRAASNPIRLPYSHDRWGPIATAEGWNGGTGGGCSPFLYRFNRIQIARGRGGTWHPLSGGFAIRNAGTRIRHRGAALLAAEGRAALSLLPSVPF
jgi:hypothetical protein